LSNISEKVKPKFRTFDIPTCQPPGFESVGATEPVEQDPTEGPSRPMFDNLTLSLSSRLSTWVIQHQLQSRGRA
jgi:hypothetical protein